MSTFGLAGLPRELICERKAIDMADFRRRSASENDFATLINEPTIIREPGAARPSIVYLEINGDFGDITHALEAVDYYKAHRTEGMMSHSRVFGNQPKAGMRRQFCTKASMGREYPKEHDILLKYMQVAGRFYSQFHPELYESHGSLVREKIIDEWRVADSVFTSGIANKNNPLPYHHDRGNFAGCWSNMFCFKKDVEGGYLSIPEYNVGFFLKSNSLLMFDGQDLLHGVTPIRKLKEDGYRYTVVFYSLQQMWRCKPPDEEVRDARLERTKREKARLERQRNGTELAHRQKLVNRKKSEPQNQRGKGWGTPS